MIALITGAGNGIGKALTFDLARRGHSLLLVDFNPENLKRTTEELNEQYPSQVLDGFLIDLAQLDAADKLYAWTIEKKYEVDILVNNAGMFSYRDLVQMDAARIEKMLLLHNMTLTKNCRFFGEEMIKRGKGYVLNMSSLSLWMPYPGLSIYAATKSYVHAFSKSFRQEARESGVRVTASCPSGVATDLYGLSPKLQKVGLNIGVLITPQSCAKRSLNAMFKGKSSIVPGWWHRAFIPFASILPYAVIKFIRTHTLQFQK